jgi:hypothetical protein
VCRTDTTSGPWANCVSADRSSDGALPAHTGDRKDSGCARRQTPASLAPHRQPSRARDVSHRAHHRTHPHTHGDGTAHRQAALHSGLTADGQPPPIRGSRPAVTRSSPADSASATPEPGISSPAFTSPAGSRLAKPRACLPGRSATERAAKMARGGSTGTGFPARHRQDRVPCAMV